MVRACIVSAAVFLCAVAPFARSVGYGIVNCDDYAYAATYAGVTDGVTGRGLKWAAAFDGEGIWMPLTWLSYMLDYEAAAKLGLKDEAGVYHVMHAHSVALHGVNAALLFGLLLIVAGGPKTGRGILCAALAALVWAAHPLRCESVCWIASRKDVLSMMGLLLALLCWTRWRGGGRRTSFAWYGAAIVCFALGGMAKPSVMCFPALAFILDWFFLRRGLREVTAFFRMAAGYVLPVVMAAGLAVLAQRMQTAGGCTVEFQDMPLWGRLLNAAVSFGLYPVNTVWPFGLAPQCVLRWPHLPRLMVPGLCVTVAFGVWLWRALQPERGRLRALFAGSPEGLVDPGPPRPGAGLVAGAVWYAVAILPFLGVSAFGYHALADRFTYIPAVGLSLALVGVLRGRVSVGCAALAVLALGGLAWRQTGIWRDDRAMWEQTIKVDGEGNGVATAGLGLWHYEFNHDSPESVEWFEKAFAADPDCLQKTGFLYINNLAEHGRLAQAAERLRWSAEWSLAVRDQERQVRGLDASIELKPLVQHRLARIAYLIHCPDMRTAGEEYLAELEALRPNDIHVLYLKGQLALLKGDWTKAEEIGKRLKQAATRKECVRYRFFDGLVARARRRAETGGGR